jgi:hypothetical protein
MENKKIHKPLDYHCGICHKNFQAPCTDTKEKMLSECLEVFGEIPCEQEQVVVCDYCYKDMMARRRHNEE